MLRGLEAAPPTDGELVGRVRAGDSSAFEALYRRHVGAAYRAVFDVIRDREASGDIVQEVFVRSLEQLSRLRDPGRFLPWLISIARHTAIDHRRYQMRVSALDEERIGQVPDVEPGPDSLAELSELAELIRGCLATLSRRDALVVSLITYLGFSPGDIASALGVSRTSAKVIAHRARRRLRTALSLELMVRRAGPTCSEFRRLHDEGDLVGAARHVASCPACETDVAEEVQAYDARVLPVAISRA